MAQFMAAVRGEPSAPSAMTTSRFGVYGGQYVPETLMPALEELEAAFDAAQADPAFTR